MENDFVEMLLASPALTLLVADRIDWNRYPQGVASPAIRLTLVSSVSEYTHQGQDSMIRSVVQMDIRDRDYPGTIAVRDVLRDAISGYRGTFGATQFGGIFLLQERQDDEHTGSQTFHRSSIDAEIWHSPA